MSRRRHQHYTPPAEQEPDLFSAPAPRHRQAKRAEQLAADKITPRVGTLRYLVWAWFAGVPDGTDDELCRAHPHMNPRSLQPRLTELENAGLIEDTGATRPNGRGNEETIYRIKVRP